MSHVVQARPWADVAAELRRLTTPRDPPPLGALAGQLAGSPYAAGVYGAVSLGAAGTPVLHVAQTPWLDPERGAVSASEEDGRVVIRYHAAPGTATVVPPDESAFRSLERFFLARRWFMK